MHTEPFETLTIFWLMSRNRPRSSVRFGSGAFLAFFSFRTLAFKGFPSECSKSVCVRLHSENSEPKTLVSQTTPDEHPPTPPPCRSRALVTSRTPTKCQLVWHRLCDDVLFRSSCLFKRTLCDTRGSTWSYYSCRNLASNGFPGGYSKRVCPLHSETPNPRWFSQITPDEHPRRHHLADVLRSSLYAPSQV